MKKILWMDVETTGFNPQDNSIVQIAGMIEIDGEIKKTFDFKVRPIPGSSIDPNAMAVHGMTEEQVMTFPEAEQVRRELVGVFSEFVDCFDKNDKFIVGGYNVKFDMEFLFFFFKRLGDNYLGSYLDLLRVIDVFPIVRALLAVGIIDAQNAKLGSIADYYKISIDAHDALSDVRATRKIWQRLCDQYFLPVSSEDDSKNVYK